MRFLELCEEPINDGTDEIVRDFVDFAGDRLGLKRPPKIKLIRDPKQAAERKSFGGYMPGGGIEINIGNRHIMDVLRTLAHEMVHHKQDVAGELNDRSGEDGSPEENEANAKAAVIMRLWAKMNPELFQHASILAEQWRKMRANEFITEDWNKANRRDKTDGLSQKAVNAYRRENPGSKLQTAVTTKPSKLKPGSKAAKRRKSFCARMSGNKGPMKKPNGKPTPKALALRRWNCESVEHMVDMIIENMDHAKDNQAVPELKAALLAKKAKLQTASEDDVYDIIDTIMTRIAKSHGISGQKLHDMWVDEYDQVPDTWIMK